MSHDSGRSSSRVGEASPALAFARFVQLASSPETLRDATEAELLDLVTPFLENPRHLPHVQMIIEGAATRKMLRKVRPFERLSVDSPPARFLRLDRLYKRQLNRTWEKNWHKRAQERLAELQATVSPGEVRMSVLPITFGETRPEYRAQGKQAYEIRLVVDVEPAADLSAAALGVRLEPMDAEDVQAIDVTPEGSLTEESSYTTEQDQRVSASQQSKASVGIDVQGVGAGLESSSDRTLEEGKRSSETGTRRAPKIISGAAEQTARWQFLRTSDQLVDGGFDLTATFLVPDGTDSLLLRVTTTVEFEGWGTISTEKTERVNLPVSAEPAAVG